MVKKRKRSILFEWAGAYLVVLLIPLITIFLNHYSNMKILREEIYNANRTVLENIGDEIDQIMTQQINTYNYLYSDIYFHSWISHAQKTPEFYDDAYKLQKQIAKYVKHSSDVYCLLYMVDENYVLSNDFANDARYVFLGLNMLFTGSPEYEDWIKLLSGTYNNEFLFMENINAKFDQKCLVYADSLELSGNKLVNIFVSVPLERIAELTSSLNSNDCLVMNCGDLIEVVNNDEFAITPELRSLIINGEDTFETDDYMGIAQKSRHRGFHICILMAQKEFWAKSMYIRNIFGISIVVTILVAFGAVSFLLDRNFAPLSKLLEIISGEKKAGNEFNQIEEAFQRLKNENKSMQEVLHTQKDVLQGTYLLSAMKGFDQYLSDREMDFFGLDRERPVMLCGFCVASEDALLRFAIDNVFSELMEGEQFCCINDRSYLLYLLFAPTECKEKLPGKCDQQAEVMEVFFEEKWGIRIAYRRTESFVRLIELENLYQELMQKFAAQPDSMPYLNVEGQGIVTDIVEYIRENYSDSNLNIASVAEFLNKNPRYISRIFRESTGLGILDYVNQIRIEKAEELIAVSHYSAEEIGSIVGYASYQTFRRAFMKWKGTTPGKYMENLHTKK